MAVNDEFETGMYDDPASAEGAVRPEVKWPPMPRTGAAIGGGLGAIIAGLTATGSVAAIVGTGGAAAPLVAGPLAAALAGLGAGGAAGGIVGALVGAGIPEPQAKRYADRLSNGGILLGVKPRPENREQVREIFPAHDEAGGTRLL